MTHYLASKDQQYTSEIKAALERQDALVMNTLTAETQARSRQLFTYLCGNVRGRLLTMLKDPVVASTSNGYEAMRRFHLDIEPRSGAAALGLLETILMVPAPPKGTNLRDAIISVERLFTDYEATSHEVLSEHVKIAALRRLLPPEIKVHVNMLVKDTTTYADVKATVTEYEVAERSYTPLKEASVYDHTSGAVPMDVDQVQASKGGKAKGKSGSKGKSSKGDKPSVCKHCGKAHKGECWYKDGKSNASGKGKASGQKGKGSSTGDTQGAKTKCQICGKTNHTADKCYQRYKEGDAKGKVNQVTAPETGATVTVVRQQEADTSPETELRVTSTGVRFCTDDGRAMVLIDSGSDEHSCPEDFAPWCRTTTRRNGPVLRDAQGSVISHESRYRIDGLKFYGADRMTAEIEIPFLIGPVNQPILSLGKLVAGLNAQLKIGAEGGDVLQLDGMTFKVTRMLQNYYIPCYPWRRRMTTGSSRSEARR